MPFTGSGSTSYKLLCIVTFKQEQQEPTCLQRPGEPCALAEAPIQGGAIHSAMNIALNAADAIHLDRILIVDDHPFFSEGLAFALRQSGLVDTVDSCGSVSQARDYLRRFADTDLVLLDLLLPDAAGLTLIHALTREGLPIPVVVVSSREDENAIRAARAAGAQGFMRKSAGAAALAAMMLHIQQGRLWFPDEPMAQDGYQPLTPRQQDVLELLSAGLPNKRICQELDLTEHTVKTHLKAIFASLQVHNRTECVLLARELGLVN